MKVYDICVKDRYRSNSGVETKTGKGAIWFPSSMFEMDCGLEKLINFMV